MVDLRIIWERQLRLCKEIADDIIKHEASIEICEHTAKYALIEAPFKFNGMTDYSCDNFIRINFGEAYCYIDLDKNNKPTSIRWCNDEMGVKNDTSFDGTLEDLQKMDLEHPYNICADFVYDEYAGRETEYILPYTKMQKGA